MTTATNEGAPEGTQTPPQGTEGTSPASTESTPPVRPENVPEQFWDAEKGTVNTEALLASYTELTKPQTPPAEGTQTPPAEGEQTPPEGTQTSAYAAAVTKAEAELAEKGTLSDETYAQFEKTGVTREQIDAHIEGQQAKFELRKLHAEREVGGEEVYTSLLQWAGSNYSAEDAEAFNNTVFGPSRDEAMKAVRTLKARYEDAMGTEGKIVTDGTGTPGSGGYTNKAEWMADLKKPEYKKDAAFRDQVRKKLEASLRNGVSMGVGVSVG